MMIVVVGAPFEAQTFYGPFKNVDDAIDFSDTVLGAYTWIVNLIPPSEMKNNDAKQSKSDRI